MSGPGVGSKRRFSRSLGMLGVALLASSALLVSTNARAEPEKKAIPRYDGRAPPEPSAGDVALVVPRALLYPLYLISEYLVRRPLGALVSWAERKDIPRILYDFFAFGPDHKAGFAPIALIDFGFSPSAGLYFFWNDAGIKGHSLSVHGSTWGGDWLAGSVRERYRWNENDAVTLRLTGLARPDNQYFGTGARTVDADRTRYGVTRLETSLLYERRLSKRSALETGVAVRSLSFRDSHWGGDPSTSDLVAAGHVDRPAAFDTGYVATESRVRLAVDSRSDEPSASHSGLLVELDGAAGQAPGTPRYGWGRYDAVARGMLDLNGHERVVSLAVGAFFADPWGKDAAVPFTELATLGGAGPMPGYAPGRLYGRSALVATLQYQWPIWMWLNGTAQASLGNVFAAHLDDVKPRLLRYAAAIGISQIGDTDNPLQVLFGLGSETFEHGGQVTSVRLTAGTSYGY